MNLLLYLAEAFMIAYIMKAMASRLHIPSVSGYVIGGIVLSGSLLFWLPSGREFSEYWLFGDRLLDQLVTVTDIALGIIAFSIGVELEWKRLKSLGRSIVFITVFEAFGAFLLVTLVTYLFQRDLPFALILGAVSSATAPSATVAVIQQYRAKGPLTNTILSVIGIDDAVSLIIFAFALAVTRGSLLGVPINFVDGVVVPMGEIFLSLLLGTAVGGIMARLTLKTTDHESILFLFGGAILFISGIASHFHLSQLLANMAFGSVLVNINPLVKARVRSSFGSIMPVFYALFFLIGGAHLHLEMFPSVWLIALLYFCCRTAGKSLGAWLGAVAGKALPQVRAYVGMSLLPQVGVAIALALVIQDEFGSGAYGSRGIQMAADTMNILLVTTLLTEFIGPYLTKRSLVKAGEVSE